MTKGKITWPSADGAYFAVSALRTVDNKRIVLGGSDDLSRIEDWFAANATRFVVPGVV